MMWLPSRKLTVVSLLKFIEFQCTLTNFNRFLINFNCQFPEGYQGILYCILSLFHIIIKLLLFSISSETYNIIEVP